MSEREIWILAGEILAQHAPDAMDRIFDRMGEVISDTAAVEDRRRVAEAIDQNLDKQIPTPSLSTKAEQFTPSPPRFGADDEDHARAVSRSRK